MGWLIGQAKELCWQIKGYDAAAAVLKRSQTSHNATDNQKNVFGSIALNDDCSAAAVTNRATSKREKVGGQAFVRVGKKPLENLRSVWASGRHCGFGRKP